MFAARKSELVTPLAGLGFGQARPIER